jgi:signal transduction histidine kinase
VSEAPPVLGGIPWRLDWRRQRFTYMDARVVELLGYPSESWVTLDDWADRMHPEDSISLVGTCLTDAARGQDQQLEYRARCRDGGFVWLRCIMHPVSESGCTTELRGLFVDIDEERRIEAETLAAVAANVESDDEKLNGFVRSISHDLKSPLSAINGYGELLRLTQSQRLDENGQSYVTAIMDGSARLIRFIEDLAAYTRADREKDVHRSVDMDQALADALANLTLEISASGAQISYQSLPAVTANAGQMTQLFQNFIQNAIKYRHPDRNPEVHISVGPDGERADSCRFTISDNGMGIAAGDLEKVFQPFSRVNQDVNIEGSGIGLATCQKIVGHYGGQLWLESTLGNGCDFHFCLPVATTA